MWTAPVCALLLQLALGCTAALLARRAKVAALVLAAVSFFGAPWLAGPIPLLRAFSALLGWVGMFRIVDTVRSREPWSASRRLLHVISFVDSRTLRRAPPRIDLRALGRALLWAALAIAGIFLAIALSPVRLSPLSPRLLARWASGLVLAYAGVEAGYAFIFVTYRALGFVTPRLHVWPLASLSIAELWGARWARPVSAWLRENCFRPLARIGHPALGVVLGFVVSAIGHAYPIFVAVGLPMAACMFAFFFAQGLFVVLEARLGASRWPRAARRAWTVTLMIASSPLFVEPALRALGLF
jgi:hypothetical protein